MIRFFLILVVFVGHLSFGQQEMSATVDVKGLEKELPEEAKFTHYVGELFGGGIVYNVWKDSIGEEHGLIVSLDDVSKGMVWNTYEKLTGATSLDDGAENTKIIVEALNNCSICAAGMCHQYKGGGYNDWYLPASWELYALSQNIHIINAILDNDSLEETQPLMLDYYWSSTEGSSGSAWRQNLADNKQKFFYHKYSRGRLRAVRRF